MFDFFLALQFRNLTLFVFENKPRTVARCIPFATLIYHG
jgi:hypothetical protein